MTAATQGATGTDLLEEAFALIASEGWQGFRLGRLAETTGRPLAEIRAVLPHKAALPAVLGRRLDQSMLALPMAELMAMSPRERLFELIMRRLEAMAPFRPGLVRIAKDRCLAPDLLLASCCNLRRLRAWLLDLSGAPTSGIEGAVAGKIVLFLYLRVFQVWLGDEEAEQARTMAELDRGLARAERLAGWLVRFRLRRRSCGSGAGAGTGRGEPAAEAGPA